MDTYKKLTSPWNTLISLLLWVLCLSLLCHLFLASILKEIGDDMPLMGAWSSISNKSQEAWTGPPYLVRLVRRARRLFKPHQPQPHPIQSVPIIMRPKPKYKMIGKILHLHFECVWIVCRCACACVCVFVCVNCMYVRVCVCLFGWIVCMCVCVCLFVWIVCMCVRMWRKAVHERGKI